KEFRARGCDGFNILMPAQLSALDDFVDLVLPALRRRGLFRENYRGKTLRSHLGLAGGGDQ
ncbi:nitrilotriacetate monooxygenase, partial [Mesorhizobium sp. M7A.F.Ca.AU.002.02.1.1]